jgi:hypothetical protein
MKISFLIFIIKITTQIMKKLLIIALSFVTLCSWSQGFEGTIKWSMKMEITDPEMKAKMEAGQKRMNDPANQAKMKEMEARMNDPQFKKMMEANPQMKAQMENVMKMQSGGGNPMENMMPKGMTVKLKGANSLTMMEGGMMSSEILHQGDKNQTVILDRNNKTYNIMPSGANAPGQGESLKPTVTKTSETATLLNYTCTKYIVTIQERGQTVTSFIWATTDIKDIDFKALAKQRSGRGQSIFYEGIDGVPLKMESVMPQGKMIMEVIDIKKESLSTSDFTIPSDYTETKGMFGGRN